MTALAETRPERQPVPEEWVAIDHPDRLLAQPSTMGQIFVRVDRSHELPLVVAVQVGQRLRVIARFALPGDCALAFSRDPRTLPETIVRQMAGR